MKNDRNELDGRVFFSDRNPWPEGHEITHCELVGSLYYPGGARIMEEASDVPLLELSIDIESALYAGNEQINLDEPSQDSWSSKASWHICSRFGISGPLTVFYEDRPYSANGLNNMSLNKDPLPGALLQLQDDELSFAATILKEASTADHVISFGEFNGTSHPLEWSGKLALASHEQADFCHSFRIQTNVPRLSRIVTTVLPKNPATKAELFAHLSKVVEASDDFVLEVNEADKGYCTFKRR